MDKDDVHGDIIVETIDVGQSFFQNASVFNSATQSCEINQRVQTIKTELEDEFLSFNVYIKTDDVDALSDHNYEKTKNASAWNEQIVPDVKRRSRKSQNKAAMDKAVKKEQDSSHQDAYACEICKKTFRLAYLLKSHVRKHFIKKKFVCNVCHKTFAFSNHLRNHFSIHTGEKNFTCTVCSKTFRQEGHLLNHVRTHTGVKKFSCPLCNKRFTQNIHMKSHLKTHTGEKDYVCKICSKQFIQSGQLQTHMTVHTGERRYECTQCGWRFKQSGHLSSHLKTHAKCEN